jgi:formylglycine-generating enzyme required for sulfatase activity/tRNA A-37 threonylcarbamoyl transferase component Bud32
MATPSPVADRNLIFGLLALQMDFVTREQLLDGMHAWMLDKQTALGEILCRRGVLAQDEQQVLGLALEKHLRRHGGDAQASLAALSVKGSVRQDLAGIDDPDVQASLAGLPPPPPGESPATADGKSEDFLAGLPTTGPVAGPASSIRFRRLREHARGGLGEVFVALDEELDREVALKEIQARHADHAENRARFLTEARVTGVLEHPGIVPVYGLGHYADGRPYYAMRFIKGDSLQNAVAAFHAPDRQGVSASERLLELRQLLGRFVDVCQAIAYAHSRGVIHRDLKPGNIMLGKYGETLVVDWGLAKVVGQTDVETTESVVVSVGDSALTQAGQTLGTPAYMSPEQAAGRLDRLGPASDTYSLGATLYCLLTGQAPFDKADVGVVLAKVQKGDFKPPRQVKASVPPALEAVCLKAMALKPEDRYGSPRELAGEIERWLADEPVQAYREPWRQRAGRWARRHPAVLAGTLALLFTGLVAVAVGGVLLGQEQAKTLSEQQARLQQQRKARQAQVRSLLDVAPQAVPAVLEALEPYRDEIRPLLRQVVEQPQPQQVTPEALHLWRQHRARAALALLKDDAGQLSTLTARLLEERLEPAEMLLVRDALTPHAAALKGDLWQQADQGSPALRFRVLVALAAFDPDNKAWARRAPELLDALLEEPALHLGTWVKGLRPVRDALLVPLAEVFRGKRVGSASRQVAAQVLADYAGDRPEVVIDLLVDADRASYPLLKAIVDRYRDRVVQRMRQELTRRPDWWKDRPLDPAWKQPDDALRREVEQAGGLFAERFALCQALPWERLQAVTEGLRPAGYRPVRVRPWGEPGPVRAGREGEPGPVRSGSDLRVAVVWTRDGAGWKLRTGLKAQEVKAAPSDGLPADVAGYLDRDGERFVLLCRAAEPGEVAAVYAGVPEDKHGPHLLGYRKLGYVPASLHGLTGPDGRVGYSGVWVKRKAKPPPGNLFSGDDENTFADRVTAGEQFLLDVDVGRARQPRPWRQIQQANLARARAAVLTNPRDANPHFYQGQALFYLGRDREALAALDTYFEASKAFFGHNYRAVLQARAGRAEQARRDLADWVQVAQSQALVLGWTARVEAALGNAASGRKALDEAVAGSPQDTELLVEAARVHAEAWRRATALQYARVAGLAAAPGLPGLLALAPGPEKPKEDARRAVQLLERAVAAGCSHVAGWQEDAALAVLAERPAFCALLRQARAERRYGSVWREETTREAVGLHGLSAAEHLRRCRELAAQGYRCEALSLALVSGEKEAVAASVWHRPVLPAAQKDRLAKWQGVAGATLLALGQPERIWPLCKHGADPTVRSHLVEQAGLRGTEPRVLIGRLEQEKDDSIRRALILALGEYTDKELPASLRAPLVKKLLVWYQHDPDPGIHAAVDWLLRHGKEGPAKRLLDWGQRKELERIDAELARASRGRQPPEQDPRRWYVNGQGQTFTLIQGPVTFRMGSPLTEADRVGVNEKRHVRVIPRSYALQTKAVTVAEYERFLAEHPERRFPSFPKRFSPEAGCPMIWVSWYEAAAYCNWLSKREGIPRSQWCYPEKVEEGTKLYPDYLKRTGYRLPTEAEWEHAARAGAASSWYYGSSESLLGRYAHYRDNSEDRTWPVGQQRPNDLGLFDMHGNVWTWCDNPSFPHPSGRTVDVEYMRDIQSGFFADSRALRGGSFSYHASVVRASGRGGSRPVGRGNGVGLRVCRTSHLLPLPSYNNTDH